MNTRAPFLALLAVPVLAAAQENVAGEARASGPAPAAANTTVTVQPVDEGARSVWLDDMLPTYERHSPGCGVMHNNASVDSSAYGIAVRSATVTAKRK